MLGLLLLAFGIYDYNASAPFDIKVTKVEMRQGVEVRDITYASSSGARKAAYLVVPSKKGKHPAALMVHWYAPEEHDSNRTQYLGQAVELAKLGVVSLLPETMWSEPKWFPTRKRADDYEASVRAVKEICAVSWTCCSVNRTSIRSAWHLSATISAQCMGRS